MDIAWMSIDSSISSSEAKLGLGARTDKLLGVMAIVEIQTFPDRINPDSPSTLPQSILRSGKLPIQVNYTRAICKVY